VIARRADAELLPDPARVVARLFLPGEELHLARSRASEIVARVMAIDEAEVERLVAALLTDFDRRHRDYEQILIKHAGIVAARVVHRDELTPARTLLLGATFTAEYAIEAAALCNPSAVLHPDQSGLGAGQVRVAISLRGIGEGHLSSIAFCSAIAGPGASWEFESRPVPLSVAVNTAATWQRDHLRAVLAEQSRLDELSESVLQALPAEFQSPDLERAIAATHYDLLTRSGSATTVELLRKTVSSAYTASFPLDSDLGQRVLAPTAEEESNGMEDARFTYFVGDDGAGEYRATYTAYDGRQIAPRLLVSSDLRIFHAHRLAGPAARNKGMALFPRKVKGEHLCLCRSDGESTSLASSSDGYVWSNSKHLQGPQAPWEMLQVGNCGAPIETDQGWLVLTHGVGPMRVYVIGAILLDLDDPSQVIGRVRSPIVLPGPDETDGYVPNVVYSCGAFVHDGILWIPYGVDDSRIRVAYLDLESLLAELRSSS
jgi:predicted GH43/DUF377 family glycosyl hydrolase